MAGVPGWGTAAAFGAKFLSGLVDAWNNFTKKKERQEFKKDGATAQKEKNHAEELKVMRDDRVRDGNDDLSERVRRDRGIESGGDS